MRTDETLFYFELSCTLPSYSVPFSDSDESSFLDHYILLCSDHHFELGKKESLVTLLTAFLLLQMLIMYSEQLFSELH